MSEFKKIKVRDMRKMIKDLNLKKKNPALKGYSYKKKGQMIEILKTMNIPDSDLEKYRSERKKMSKKQSEALKKGRAKPKVVKKKPEAKVKKPVKMIVNPEADKFKVMFVDDDGEVRTKGEYNSESESIKEFNKITKMNKNMKVYIIEFMKSGNRQIIRSYKKPMIKLNRKKKYK